MAGRPLVTAILGISAFYHDSAAALVQDGHIIAAAQEERFSRVKHDAAFPTAAISYCLHEADLTAGDLDYIVFYEKPFAKFERLLETYLAYAPVGLRSFSGAMATWLKDKLWTRRRLRRELGSAAGGPILFLDHHESHAASAFFPSPFEQAAILTLDGVGEWSTACHGVGEGNRIRLTHHLQFPHSLGLLYSAFTYYCGFKVNSGEYKLMGLAPFGRPIYRDAIYRYLIDLKDDGSLWLNMRYFNYCQGLTMTSRPFHRLFGGPPRAPAAVIEQRHMDLAASIQAVTEEAVLRMARHVHDQTKLPHLVCAGGVALNCVANGRLLREGPFDQLWVQPAAGDAGGALGASLFAWHQLLDQPRRPEGTDFQQGSLLGPGFASSEIAAFLNQAEVVARHFPDESDLLRHTAGLLADEKVVGWFQGRMEFGPRALGSRSILGDPRSPKMQFTLNLKIKSRESFRPFAPAVLQEHAHEWFDLPANIESPYMLLTAVVLHKHRAAVPPEQELIQRTHPDLRQRLNVVRSRVPAATHIDYSARVQTVDEARNPRFYRLLQAFHAASGCPILVNTSFNVRGEPIVCTPREAYRCFMATDMDALVLEDFVVHKQDMPPDDAIRRQHLASIQSD
jgi:carbamoyltransferase